MWRSGTALADVVAWSAELPLWQRDALRRLTVSGSLTSVCHDELMAICCGYAAAPAVPLDATHVAADNKERRVVGLKAIRIPVGVNALTKGQVLSFAERGLTVVYGENGAGKSGYARILKSACRARGAIEVLGNVYDHRADATPTAEVEFVVGGKTRVTTWRANAPSDNELTAISVFDSNTAMVRVDQANDVAYTPLPLRLLSDLSTACATLEARLKEERKRIEARQPAWLTRPTCVEGTQAMAAMKAIGADTDVDKLIDSLRLSEQEEAQRSLLSADVQQDEAILAKDLSKRGAGLGRLLDVLSKAAEAASPERLQALEEASARAIATRAAANAASSALFGSVDIPGIGGEAWRVLWEAARRFSETVAYQKRPFPVVDDGSRCLLCVQPLDGAASARLSSFEKFVQADIQLAAKQAEAKFSKAHEPPRLRRRLGSLSQAASATSCWLA